MNHNEDSAVHRVQRKNINNLGKDKQMKSMKMIAVLALAVAVMALPAKLAIAAPMGSAFTYQGRLILGGSPVTGEYDLQFKLYDSLVGGTQVASTLDAPEVDVNEGHFTVLLDFGSAAFAGDARWLEIGVREGALSDPEPYDVFAPRQELTPAPYALYAASAPGGGGADSDWQISGSNMFSMPLGNVGIGTTTPSRKLDVNGQGRFDGQLYARDATGIGLVDDAGNLGLWVEDGGNVGIGTTSPAVPLHVKTSSSSSLKVAGLFTNPSDSSSAEVAIQLGLGTMLPTAWMLKGSDYGLYIGNAMVLPPTITITGGSVGINTTSPDAVLDVYGTRNIGTTSDGIVNIGSSAATHVTLDNNEIHARSGSNPSSLYINDFGGNVYIARDGSVQAGKSGDTSSVVVRGHLRVNYMSPTTSGSTVRWYSNRLYYYSSSKKYKQDILPFQEDFHKILQAEPKSFTCKTTGEPGIGYIAEEFDELGLGSLVTYNNDGQPDALKYELVSLYLLEVVKGQVETIKQLETNNQSLEQRLEALETMMQQHLLTVTK